MMDTLKSVFQSGPDDLEPREAEPEAEEEREERNTQDTADEPRTPAEVEADLEHVDEWRDALDEWERELRAELKEAEQARKWAWRDLEHADLQFGSNREEHREALQAVYEWLQEEEEATPAETYDVFRGTYMGSIDGGIPGYYYPQLFPVLEQAPGVEFDSTGMWSSSGGTSDSDELKAAVEEIVSEQKRARDLALVRMAELVHDEGEIPTGRFVAALENVETAEEFFEERWMHGPPAAGLLAQFPGIEPPEEGSPALCYVDPDD